MRINFYHFLFARCYYWSQKINGKFKDPVFFSAAMVCQILLVNVVSMVFVLEIIGIPIAPELNSNWVHTLLVAVSALVVFELNHKYFKHNEKYLSVISKYPFSGSHRFVGLYVVGSLVFMAVSMYLAFQLKWDG